MSQHSTKKKKKKGNQDSKNLKKASNKKKKKCNYIKFKSIVKKFQYKIVKKQKENRCRMPLLQDLYLGR